MKYIFIICLLLGILAISLTSFAKTDSLFTSITLGGNYQQGNINNTTITSAGELSGYGRNHFWSILPTYKYLINDLSPSNASVSKQNELYSVQNYTFRTNQIFKLMVFSEIEHSQIKRIDLRANLGFGAGLKILKTDRLEILASEVMLPDYYKSLLIKLAHPQRDNLSLRMSTRLKIQYKLDKNITFTSVNLFQPAIYTKTLNYDYNISTNQNTNFRSSNQIDFLIKGGLSMGISIDYLYQTYLQWIQENDKINISPSDFTAVFYLKYKR